MSGALAWVRWRTGGRGEGGGAWWAGGGLAWFGGLGPRTLHGGGSGMNFSGGFLTCCYNVPGRSRSSCSAAAVGDLPDPVPAGERALAIAIMSYDGKVGFGLLGDYDALPDLDVVAEGIEASLAQLVALQDGRLARLDCSGELPARHRRRGARPARPGRRHGGDARLPPPSQRGAPRHRHARLPALRRAGRPRARAGGGRRPAGLPVLPSHRGRARLPLARGARAAGARRDPRPHPALRT